MNMHEMNTGDMKLMEDMRLSQKGYRDQPKSRPLVGQRDPIPDGIPQPWDESSDFKSQIGGCEHSKNYPEKSGQVGDLGIQRKALEVVSCIRKWERRIG